MCLFSNSITEIDFCCLAEMLEQTKMIVMRAIEFDAAFPVLKANGLFAEKAGDPVILPAHNSLFDTSRHRFVINKHGKLELLHRSSIEEVYEFLLKNSESQLYVHGPQGVGKSHALYYAVCALRK